MHCVDWSDVPEAMSASGAGKREIPGAGATLVMVRIPAGTDAARHSHGHEQFVQVISGAGTLATEQGASDFRPGSVFHFPAGAWHAAHFSEETILVETNLRA